MNLTLLILGCNAYPEDANLSIIADSVDYKIYGDVAQERISELGMTNNPTWLYDLQTEIKVEVSIEQDGKQRILYDHFYLDEQGRRVAPSLSYLLDKAEIIGSNCGFHHPDSHDPCYAGVKVSEPVTLTYRVSPFPSERNTRDNTTAFTFSLQDLEGHAQVLSSVWAAQEGKEVEEEERALAEKRKGLK